MQVVSCAFAELELNLHLAHLNFTYRRVWGRKSCDALYFRFFGFQIVNFRRFLHWSEGKR